MTNPDMIPRPPIRATSILLDEGRICLVKQEVTKKKDTGLFPEVNSSLEKSFLNVYPASLKRKRGWMFRFESCCMLPIE